MIAEPAEVPCVHVNALRWFVERDGGAEFVRSCAALHDEAVVRALAATYPDTLHVLATLGASGVGADCWFTVEEAADTVAALASAHSAGCAPGVSLGGLSLSVAEGDRDRIAARAAVTGLTCVGPDDEAIARAAVALADAFGPQVVWDAELDDVMLVEPGMALTEVRARWRSGGTRSPLMRPPK